MNKARQAIPTEAAIWITAAKLEEANSNTEMVEKIINRALKSLQSAGVVVQRESWMKEAEAAEKGHPPSLATCKAIVNAVVELGKNLVGVLQRIAGSIIVFVLAGAVAGSLVAGHLQGHRQVCRGAW